MRWGRGVSFSLGKKHHLRQILYLACSSSMRVPVSQWGQWGFKNLYSLPVSQYRSLHGTAPRYLSDFLRRVADWPSRRRLRSATSSQFDVRPSRLVTVGDRSFGSVGPKLWNSLPDDTTSASSLWVFRKKLKTHLFRLSYPDVIL